MSDLKPVCGIVMPLSEIDDCPAAHWSEVQEIFSDAIATAGFEASLVSDADDTGVIHKRIIQNLYENPIVVCDVSGKNPNVMFELGLRLAFDKPTIIVKDNVTSYSFDTSPIEHLDYPRDLRYNKIVEFKQKLAEKIKSTHAAANSDKSYTTFLKHFGEFTIPKLEKKEIPEQQYVLEELSNLRLAIERLSKQAFTSTDGQRARRRAQPLLQSGILNACMRGVPLDQVKDAETIAKTFPGVTSVRLIERTPDHYHLHIKSGKDIDLSDLRDMLWQEFPR